MRTTPLAVVDHDLAARARVCGRGDDDLRGGPLAVDHAVHPAVAGSGAKVWVPSSRSTTVAPTVRVLT